MSKTITKQEVLNNKEFYIEQIKQGKIFIYPTDTIYGIGCNATKTNDKQIKKIKQIKKRDKNKPLSIIAPSKEYIKKNFKTNTTNQTYINKLPGPYTFILEKQNQTNLSKEISPKSKTIGIRIPDNWFTKLITDANIPFITTSTNKSGEEHITKINQLKNQLINQVDYIINDKEINNKPSTIIDLTKPEPKIIRE